MGALRFWRFLAWVIRVKDVPRGWNVGRGRFMWWRDDLFVLEHRYRAAESVYGRDDRARAYDYIPF